MKSAESTDIVLNEMASKYLSVMPNTDSTGLYIRVAETFVYLATSITKVFALKQYNVSSFIRDRSTHVVDNVQERKVSLYHTQMKDCNRDNKCVQNTSSQISRMI